MFSFLRRLFFLILLMGSHLTLASNVEDWSRYFDSSVSGKVSVLPEAFKHFEKKAPEDFIRCLQEKVGEPGFSSFSINDVRWKKNHLKAIFKILQGSSLNTLDLNGCTFRSQDIEAMVNFFPERLKNLYLSKTNINDILLPGLGQKLIPLETIDLSLTSISGFSLHHIMMIINISQSLKSMDLSQTALSDMGAEKLPEVIEKAQGLESFKIYGTLLRKDPIGQRVQEIMDTRTFQRNKASSSFDEGIRQTLEILFHNKEKVSTLSLKDLTLSQEDVSALSLALKYSSCLEDVRLEGDLLSDEDIPYVMDALRHHGDLRSFVWKNRVLSERSLKDLGLDNFKHLAFLDLTSAHLGPLCCQVLFPSLETLVLADNEMNDDIACAFADVLASHQSLKNLNLDGNPLGVKGVSEIHESLSKRQDFQILSLEETPFSSILNTVKGIAPLTERRFSKNKKFPQNHGDILLQEEEERRLNKQKEEAALKAKKDHEEMLKIQEEEKIQSLKTLSINLSGKNIAQGCKNLRDNDFVETLTISGGFLTSNFFEILIKKTSIKSLNLQSVVSIPLLSRMFQELCQLTSLSINITSFIESDREKVIACLEPLKNLKHLSLFGNYELSNADQLVISNLTNLEKMVYSKPNQESKLLDLKFLHSLYLLKSIYVMGTLNHIQIDTLIQHPSLEEIKTYQYSSAVSKDTLTSDVSRSQLRHLEFSNYCPIDLNVNALIISHLPNLRQIQVKHSSLNFSIFKEFLKSPTIESIDFSSADMSDFEPFQIPESANLREINLSGKVCKGFCGLLGSIKSLQKVSLPAAPIGKEGFKLLVENPHIKELVVRQCQIGDIDFDLPDVSSLEILDLSGNALSDKSAPKIAEFIEKSVNIKSIFLGNKNASAQNFNKFTEVGGLAIAEALKKNGITVDLTSMPSLGDSVDALCLFDVTF